MDRHLLALTLALMLGIGGCSKDQQRIAAPDARAGSRLAMNVLVDPDGRETFWSFHDTALGTDCSFRTAADGVLRCLPFAHATSQAGLLYQGTCTNLPGCVRTGGTEYPFIRLPADSTCPERWRVFKAGALVPNQGLGWAHHRPDGVCEAIPSMAVVRCVAPGDEIPPERFVAAVESGGAADADLQLRELRAEDGAWAIAGARDLHTDTACRPEPDAVGTLRCLPATRAVVEPSFFSDGACSVPIERLPASWGGCAPPVAFATATLDCRRRSRVFELGAPTSLGSIAFPQQCVPGYWPFFLDLYWSVGAEIPPTAPIVGEQTERGSRLRPISHVLAGTTVPGDAWEDTALGIRCQPGLAADGVYRCLPLYESTGTADSTVFADRDCTIPLAWADGCAPKYAADYLGTYYAIGAPHTGDAYARGPSLTCEVTTYRPAEAVGAAVAFVTTGVVPSSTFVQFRQELRTR
ncbi:MAG TPA: hypothetical protein VFP50_15805 [Anaeromyxobacteraceae bacterium]|nr:hypothetical protein [Anaeromyxobacteraceae bacterium]